MIAFDRSLIRVVFIVLNFVALQTIVFAQSIPTPESVLGHKPGDDFYLATYDESLDYFKKLDAATDKLQLVNVGKTSEGRDWFIALISTAENLRNLEKYKEIAKRVARCGEELAPSATPHDRRRCVRAVLLRPGRNVERDVRVLARCQLDISANRVPRPFAFRHADVRGAVTANRKGDESR